MKKILLVGAVLCTVAFWTLEAQTVDAQYLNPKLGTGNPQKHLRFGTSAEYYAGFMWNNNDTNYGNGDDFSIFTYGNRDFTIRTGTGNFIVFPSSGGNMGIGTTNPQSKLDISRIGVGVSLLKFSTERPWEFIQTETGATSGLALRSMTDGKAFRIQSLDGINNAVFFTNNTASNNKIFLLPEGGSVGIGTTNPGTWKLAVNGNIRAKEIKVETGWSDFVFEENYSLPTLEEVEQYIKEKGHLKDIPSAKEVEANGIFLGEMDAKLLQKIEELTLYIIELNKKIERQQKEIEQLKR